MLRIIRTLILLTLFAGTNASYGQQEFLTELGPEKAESFQKLMDSYRSFLNTNFPSTSNLGEQTRKFMMGMVNEKPLTYDSLDAIRVINSLEQSGLRKEICLYSGEIYDSTYNLRQFLTEEYVNEIDENIALNNREINVNDSLKRKLKERFDQLPPEQKK